jgi:hypothetical protein
MMVPFLGRTWLGIVVGEALAVGLAGFAARAAPRSSARPGAKREPRALVSVAGRN